MMGRAWLEWPPDFRVWTDKIGELECALGVEVGQ
jgi:hypothetical protein